MLSLSSVTFSPPESEREPGEFIVIESRDWINVIARTPSGDLVLVKQFRFGTESFTLELPGGMCDPDETPLRAAKRELREETGYEAEKWIPLGYVEPNPALQTNRCHTFLAEGAIKVGELKLDEHERIEVSTMPAEEVFKAVERCDITHALVVAALLRWKLYERSESRISTR